MHAGPSTQDGHYYYEVHHLKSCWNVDPRALAVVPRRVHLLTTHNSFTLPEPRTGWGT